MLISEEDLKKLNDGELFELLNSVSEEVKRRNNLLGPSVSDVRNQPVEKTVAAFIEALNDLGVKIK